MNSQFATIYQRIKLALSDKFKLDLYGILATIPVRARVLTVNGRYMGSLQGKTTLREPMHGVVLERASVLACAARSYIARAY